MESTRVPFGQTIMGELVMETQPLGIWEEAVGTNADLLIKGITVQKPKL